MLKIPFPELEVKVRIFSPGQQPPYSSVGRFFIKYIIMKICYCDVNNQFARYLHSINHPLATKHFALKNDSETKYYYVYPDGDITWGQHFHESHQVSLGEFIGNITSLKSNPELIIPLMLFGNTPPNSELEDCTTYRLDETKYFHLQILKCFIPILNNFEHKQVSICTTPNDGATFFICNRNACITINAWKAQHNINKLTTKSFTVTQPLFLSLLASLFKDKQLIYNLLTNLCSYFKAELLNEKELSSLIKYFKDHYGNTNQLQEEDINFTNRSSTGECRSYGQGSKVAVRFGYLSNRARIVASTSNCHIITTEISTKCSRDS